MSRTIRRKNSFLNSPKDQSYTNLFYYSSFRYPRNRKVEDLKFDYDDERRYHQDLTAWGRDTQSFKEHHKVTNRACCKREISKLMKEPFYDEMDYSIADAKGGQDWWYHC